MTSRLSLLLASTALTALIGLPVLAATHAPVQCGTVCVAPITGSDPAAPLIRVSDDDDEDDDEGDDEGDGWFLTGDDDDDCGGDDDDDDDDCGRGQGNPAPAGSTAPPANGLFGNGAPPVAVTK